MTATSELYASGTPAVDPAGTWTSGGGNPGMATGAPDATTARWGSSVANASAWIQPAGFGIQTAIGSEPTSIDSLEVSATQSCHDSRIVSWTMQLTDNGTPIGSPQSLTRSTTLNTQTRTFTGVTWAQLANLGVRLVAVRGDNTLLSTAAVDAVGIVTNYTTLTPVSASRSTTWNTLKSESASRSTTWDVEESLTPVAASRSTTWVTAAEVSASRESTWTTLAAVEASRQTTWTVAGQVEASRSTEWAVLYALSAERNTTWTTSAAIMAARQTFWTTSFSVEASRSTTWAVLAEASAARSTLWETRSAASAERSTLWTTYSGVEAARATAWAVSEGVTASRSTTWAVLAAVEGSRQTLWVVAAMVEASRATTWNVEQEGLQVPQNLVATPVSQSEIDLTWTSIPTATGYDVERDGAVIAYGHPTNSYPDTGLDEDTEYTYRVRAVYC